MSNLLEKKNRNIQLTGLRTKNPNEENFAQKLRKTAKNLDWIANKAKKATALASKSNKMQLEPSPEQLDILSVKEDNGQVMIEFRAPNTSAPSISGTDGEPHSNQKNQDGITEIKVENEFEFGATSISAQSIHTIKVEDEVDIKKEAEMEFCALNSTAQSIHTIDADPCNYDTVNGWSTAIKVEDEVDIKMEDEMEFCALNSIVQSTDDGDLNNQPIQDPFAEIKIEDEIEFSEPSISVQSIPTNDDDEFTETEDETECGEEMEIDGLNTPGTMVANKPDASEGNKQESELICAICSTKFATKKGLIRHRQRHSKPKFQCNVCDEAKFTQHELNVHMRSHDTNPIYFTCDLCPKKYPSNSYLIAHRKTHDPNAIFFTCEICHKKLQTEKSMIRHRDRHAIPNFICKVCLAAKFTKVDLNRHMRMHYTNPKYFKCEICSKKYSSKGYLFKHMKTHDTNSTHSTCHISSKVFSTKKSMINHRNRHGKPK